MASGGGISGIGRGGALTAEAGVCSGRDGGNCACLAFAKRGFWGWLHAKVVFIQVAVGCRVGEAAGLAGGLKVMCLKSSWIVHRGCGAWTGTYLFRHLRLRRVILPDPTTHTTYWSNWPISMMMPVLPHLFACGPV